MVYKKQVSLLKGSVMVAFVVLIHFNIFQSPLLFFTIKKSSTKQSQELHPNGCIFSWNETLGRFQRNLL